MTLKNNKIPGSFRDPSGFLFNYSGDIYRQVNFCYKHDYDLLINSGLYEKLVTENLLISHKEVTNIPADSESAYKIIKPKRISFISYPYEWCFSALKDAALLTLEIQKIALDFGMSLKDCSGYNIQFKNGGPVFIDTLSFEKYIEGHPWVAYRQFCQHFLAPLLLISYIDVRLNLLLRNHIDGIPLDLASSLLPVRTRFKFSTLTHIHLHAKSQRYYSKKSVNKSKKQFGKIAFQGLIDNLISAIRSLKWLNKNTEWSYYYKEMNYSADSFQRKKDIVGEFLEMINPNTVWDFGANTGIFSRIAVKKKIQTVSLDLDPAAVDRNYMECRKVGESNILPIMMDLTNPSPSIGWQNSERMSLADRGPCDAAFALALIHHLSISNNIPFIRIAEFFVNICKSLIIEFIPKNDSQIQRLLKSREDIFESYTQERFESDFSKFFKLIKKECIEGSGRTLYLMESIT